MMFQLLISQFSYPLSVCTYDRAIVPTVCLFIALFDTAPTVDRFVLLKVKFSAELSCLFAAVGGAFWFTCIWEYELNF